MYTLTLQLKSIIPLLVGGSLQCIYIYMIHTAGLLVAVIMSWPRGHASRFHQSFSVKVLLVASTMLAPIPAKILLGNKKHPKSRAKNWKMKK